MEEKNNTEKNVTDMANLMNDVGSRFVVFCC